MAFGLWRVRSRKVIEETTLAYLRELGLPVSPFERRGVLKALSAEEGAELLKRISAAYPFGERAMHPYKIWLDEVKQVRYWVELPRKGEAAQKTHGGLFAEADQP